MVKRKVEDFSNDVGVITGVPAHIEPQAGIDPAMALAFSEIADEANIAQVALNVTKASPAPESVEIPIASTNFSELELAEKKEREKEISDQFYKTRARKQRENGLGVLRNAPSRVGDMSLKRPLLINEPMFANMVLRFVPVTDRLMSRLNGYGAVIMGEAKAEAALEVLTGYIDELHRSAKDTLDRVKLTVSNQQKKAEASGDPWHEPEYSVSAIDFEVHIMRREGNKFIESLLVYDRAVRLMRQLEFNAGSESSDIEDLFQSVRKDANKIYRSSLSGQIELGRILAGRRNKQYRANSAPTRSASEASQPAVESLVES